MHGLVGAARWGGVALAPLIDGLLDSEAREVVFFGADGADERLRGNRYPGASPAACRSPTRCRPT